MPTDGSDKPAELFRPPLPSDSIDVDVSFFDEPDNAPPSGLIPLERLAQIDAVVRKALHDNRAITPAPISPRTAARSRLALATPMSVMPSSAREGREAPNLTLAQLDESMFDTENIKKLLRALKAFGHIYRQAEAPPDPVVVTWDDLIVKIRHASCQGQRTEIHIVKLLNAILRGDVKEADVEREFDIAFHWDYFFKWIYKRNHGQMFREKSIAEIATELETKQQSEGGLLGAKLERALKASEKFNEDTADGVIAIFHAQIFGSDPASSKTELADMMSLTKYPIAGEYGAQYIEDVWHYFLAQNVYPTNALPRAIPGSPPISVPRAPKTPDFPEAAGRPARGKAIAQVILTKRPVLHAAPPTNPPPAPAAERREREEQSVGEWPTPPPGEEALFPVESGTKRSHVAVPPPLPGRAQRISQVPTAPVVFPISLDDLVRSRCAGITKFDAATATPETIATIRIQIADFLATFEFAQKKLEATTVGEVRGAVYKAAEAPYDAEQSLTRAKGLIEIANATRDPRAALQYLADIREIQATYPQLLTIAALGENFSDLVGLAPYFMGQIETKNLLTMKDLPVEELSSAIIEFRKRCHNGEFKLSSSDSETFQELWVKTAATMVKATRAPAATPEQKRQFAIFAESMLGLEAALSYEDLSTSSGEVTALIEVALQEFSIAAEKARTSDLADLNDYLPLVEMKKFADSFPNGPHKSTAQEATRQAVHAHLNAIFVEYDKNDDTATIQSILEEMLIEDYALTEMIKSFIATKLTATIGEFSGQKSQFEKLRRVLAQIQVLKLDHLLQEVQPHVVGDYLENFYVGLDDEEKQAVLGGLIKFGLMQPE